MTQVQKTILLVEDEFVIARVTAKVIQSFGFNVIIANTGEEALDIFKKSNAIDLILMDIDLGDGIDGTEVAAIILKDIDIPIVFLSSHTESEIVEKTEKITSYGYVVKGSGNTVLNASIKMAFRLFEAKLKKKEKDEALKKSEQVKSELIEKLNEAQQIEMIGSWDWDIKTGSVWWSDETYRIFGVTAQELTPSFSANARFIHPDDIQRYEQLFNHSLQSGAPLYYECRLIVNDGRLKYCVAKGTVKYDDGGNPTRFIGTIQDITARKLTEDDMRQINARLAFAQQAAGAGMWEWDMIAEKLNWTPELFCIFGLDPALIDASFETWRNIIYPQDREIAEEQIKTSIESQVRLESEYRIIRPSSGEVRWISVLGDTTYDANKKPVRMAGICLDITERKRHKEVIIESEQRINFHVKNSPLAIIEWNNNYIITQWSGESEKIFGWSKEETIGKPITDLKMIYDDDIAMVQNTMELLSSEKSKHLITSNRNYTKDRRVIHCEWYSSVLNDQQGKMISVMSQVLDITDRKLNEEKINKLLTEKEILLKEVHHRIKNNMNTVIGLMALQIDALKEQSAIAALNDARSRVQSIMLLYDKLYRSDNFSNISFKEYSTSLIDEIINNFPNSAIVKTEKIIEDFMIDAQKSSFIGIIINEILTNIMKYAFKGRNSGSIIVTARAADGRAIISIQDNGIGIPESINITNSSGFGLQLVNMMVKQLHGAIKIERNNGTINLGI